ncbi:hypothetical protein SRIMM317S_06911 [Streptomyces rimosus subsp. rimosus]
MEQQSARLGRPRSERARAAVLHAADDLLVEVGYAAMTVKGIADRAGVGRQTVYRWWSTKAEILLEASADDARQELAVEPTGDLVAELAAYLDALTVFLTRSHAGAAYRALIGEAQHDPAVAALLADHDVIGDSARVILSRALGGHLPPYARPKPDGRPSSGRCSSGTSPAAIRHFWTPPPSPRPAADSSHGGPGRPGAAAAPTDGTGVRGVGTACPAASADGPWTPRTVATHQRPVVDGRRLSRRRHRRGCP